MKRFFVLSFLAAAAALGVWYGLRGTKATQFSSTTVTNLLPKGTLALLYLPDFQRSRAQWHQTDLYQLWSEPAVQDFLSKPLARSAGSADARRRVQEMDALEIRDAFIALTALANDRPSVVAGFRFKGSAAGVEKMIGPWRTQLAEKMGEPKQVTTDYEGHKIERLSQDGADVATVYAGNWFFASNDVAGLQAVLDRVDKRVTDKSSALTADENFLAAARRLPKDYAALGYARLDQYAKKLADKTPPEAESGRQNSALRQIQSVAAATVFHEGKMKDVFFVVMPKLEELGELTRDSLALATTESFLYFATVLHWPAHLDLPDGQDAAMKGLPGMLGRLMAAGSASRIPREDWSAAFGQELGVIGDWPVNHRTPVLLITMAVKDAAKAADIVQALTTASVSGSEWTRTEKDGVQYFSQPPPNPMLPMAPTIGLSPKRLVAGLDAVSVEAAIKPGDSAGDTRLADGENFKAAAAWVPTPSQSFTYLDTALLYQRLDAALRPMLIMAAAFMPKVTEAVELGKLPAAEVITRHLSPLVASQSYDGEGYLMETVGPVSIFQLAVGGTLLSGRGAEILPNLITAGAAAPPAGPPQPTPLDTSPTPAITP